MTLLSLSTPLMLFISVAGVIQALLLAGVLYFHPKSDRSVTIYLAFHILTLSLFMLMPVFQYFFYWQSIIPLVPFQYLIGPFLYLYIRSFKEKISWLKALPHFLLFAIFLVADTLVYFQWIKKYPLDGNIPEEILMAPGSYIRIIVRNLQMLSYYFLARNTLSGYQKSIHRLYSETSRIELAWVKWLLNGFLLLIVSVLVLFFFVFSYPDYFSLFILINTAVITPYIYIVTLKGIGQPTLWQIQAGKDKGKIEKEISEAGEIGSVARPREQIAREYPDSKFLEISSRIIVLMEKEKLYQEPELTLQAVADKLGIPSYQASQAINDGLNKNFYDLVNGYRVEEAKRLLLDPKNSNFTILSVGFEAGFNSKTTFHTVFKKFTGSTPTEFRQLRKSQVAAC